MTLRFTLDESHRSRTMSRREWLRIGGLAGTGFGMFPSSRRLLANDAATIATTPAGFGRAKSAIVLSG